MLRCLLLACALAACEPLGTTATVDAFDPAAVQTGIYTLTATTLTDTCTPARFTGTLDVGVFQSGTDLGLFDGDATAQERYDLLASTGYTLDVPTSGEQLDPCGATAGDAVALSYVLTSATADQVGVVADQQWTLPTSCTSAAAAVDGATVPTTTCHATRTLRYDLAQACRAPCSIQTTTTTASDAGAATTALTCQCN